jgi:outer membrane protein TolC
VRAQEARTEEALARYESTVLHALEEVENALVSFDKLRTERTAILEAVRAANQSLDLSTTLYKDGVADFQNVAGCSARRAAFSRMRSARVDGELIQSLIRLYRALGGGWSAFGAAAGHTGGWRGECGSPESQWLMPEIDTVMEAKRSAPHWPRSSSAPR